MKKLLIIILLSATFTANAQKIKEYTATNGIIYHVGDTVKIGQGSSIDGWFKYILASSLNTSDTQRDWFKRKFTNTGLVLKDISFKEVNGIKKYAFKMGSKAMYNVFISIEEAIAACEVIPCKAPAAQTTISIADELKKMKDLLDAGAITQAEYDAQKKKLLN